MATFGFGFILEFRLSV